MFDGGNKKSKSGDDGGEEDKVTNRSLENGDSNCRFENEELPAKGTDNVKEDVSSKTGAFDENKLQKLRSKGGKKTDTVVKKGKANLEKADLELPLKALKDMLMTKNVVCYFI
nr:signal recognition particle receptor subunit alpha-like [Ipomoea batatas]GMC67000.1 signal recognition particle receptor subunit alpha-like [Ipomoea batatas]GME01506.1 signal recognition particle receptor subunit alpha-like [Ipomoea batatas]